MVSYGRFKCDRDYVGCSWSIRYTKNVKETKCIENTFDNGKWIAPSDKEIMNGHKIITLNWMIR
jgi:hypothetical protein